jgi:hypothetical protein
LVPGATQQDFWVWWLAAKLVLRHENPYTTIVGIHGLPAFYHPLPTAIATIPFAFLPENVAGPLFVGGACGLLAFAITEFAWWPLLIFLSGSIASSVIVAQLAPLLFAAMLIPSLTLVGFLKPTIGLAMLAHRPSLKAALIMLLIALASLLVRPSWPRDWLAATRDSPFYFAPWRAAGGFIVLLAAARWRRPEARLLTVLALVPQSPLPYEALSLFIIARTKTEMLVFVVLSDVMAFLLSGMSFQGDPERYMRIASPAMVWLMYAPALFMVLRRPNSGVVPSWLERRSVWLPAWLRGSPEPAPDRNPPSA